MNLPLTNRDLVCDLDLDPFGGEVTSDLQALVQDVAHVLVELNGSNPDDPTRGVGLETYLGGTKDAFNGLPGIIEEQLGRDSRINHVTCTVVSAGDGLSIALTIAVADSVVDLLFGYSSATGLINQTP